MHEEADVSPAGDFASGFSGSNFVFMFGDFLEGAHTARARMGCCLTVYVSGRDAVKAWNRDSVKALKTAKKRGESHLSAVRSVGQRSYTAPSTTSG